MGYSTPKKPLDLKEFLSQPGKKSMRRQFTFRSTQEEEPDDAAQDNTKGEDARKGTGSE